jgi:hypothetical protein
VQMAAGPFTGVRRLRTARVAATISVLGAVLGLYAWLSLDASAPDDSQMLSPARAVVPPRDNAFLALKALGEGLHRLGISGRSSARLRIPPSYDRNRALADEILGVEVVQGIPESLSRIVGAPLFQPTDEPDTQDFANTADGVLDIARLMRLRMQRHLSRGEQDAAWTIAQLWLRFGHLLQDRAETFNELGLAEATLNMCLQTVLAGSDAGQWSSTHLGALASLPETPDRAARLLAAVRNEYRSFVRRARQESAGINGLLRRVVYHPNRTRRTWLEAMAAPTAALRAGDIPGAFDALSKVATRSSPLRNSLGHMLVAGSIAAEGHPFARAVDATAEVRLVELRAAMASYRFAEGQWPPRLEDLVGRYLSALPLDPWSTPPQPFRYSIRERKVYSVGGDRHDDHGAFDENLSHRQSRQAPDDYGVRLPE